MRGSAAVLRPAWAIALGLAMAGCTDFGYEAPPPRQPDAGPDTGPGVDSGAIPGCIEKAIEPSDEGAQIRFFALDVDTPVLHIRPGDTVNWTNGSPQAHTATAGAPSAPIGPEGGGFDSGVLSAGGSRWAYRFCTPRMIEWFCATHPAQMFGYQIVIGSPEP